MPCDCASHTRELITAQEVSEQYIPLAPGSILHGECGTSVLTRVESKSPGKDKGRIFFIRSEVEHFAATLIEKAKYRARKGLHAVG